MASGRAIIASVIGVALSLYVIANLMPDAISAILNANVTGWDTALANLFQTVLPIMAVIGILALIIGVAMENL